MNTTSKASPSSSENMAAGSAPNAAGKSQSSNIGRWALLGFLLLLVLLYFVWPAYRLFFSRLWEYLSSGDVERVKALILEQKEWAVATSFFLMIFQSIVAPIPAFLITFANAAIFGWWQGAILSWTSSMAGAALCFYIARILGRQTVEKYTGAGALAAVEHYMTDYGPKTILVARLLPFISFDVVSYLAGLTPLAFLPFFVATGVGQLPATLVYSYVGGMLTGGTKLFVTALLLIFSLAILGTIIKQIYDRHHSAQKAAPSNLLASYSTAVELIQKKNKTELK